MTNIERGGFLIVTDENNNHNIIFAPINGEIWLSKSELAELFGVYIQTINSHLSAMYKTDAFNESNTSKYSLYSNGRVIKYDKTDFNLEIIIGLAFRVDSWQAELIRKWVIENVLQESVGIRYCPN